MGHHSHLRSNEHHMTIRKPEGMRKEWLDAAPYYFALQSHLIPETGTEGTTALHDGWIFQYPYSPKLPCAVRMKPEA